MATEEDRQEERDRLGNDPLTADPSEGDSEEKNPLKGPAEEEGEEDDGR